MIDNYKNKALWDIAFPAMGNKTPRKIISENGDSKYKFENYVKGANAVSLMRNMLPWLNFQGDDMNPELLEYWKNYGKGIIKQLHTCEENPSKTWVSYVPVSAYKKDRDIGKYPTYFVCCDKERPLMFMEAWGFVQLAAEEELIVIAVADGNSEKNFIDTLDQAIEQYPMIDTERVYITGYGFSAVCAGRLSLAFPERIAGFCMIGSQYYGADNNNAQKEKAKSLRMPRIDIHEMNQSRGLLPYNLNPEIPMPPKHAQNVTTSDFALLASYEEQRLWRYINGCEFFELKEMARIQETSDNIVEQKIGTKFDRTSVAAIDDVNHYIGDVVNDSGTTIMRFIGVEGCPHFPPTHAAKLSWEMLRHFSRNQTSGELIYRP